MKKFLFLALLMTVSSLIGGSAFATPKSNVTFYGKPAGWLFDLIKSPTTTRHFEIGREIGVVGATQVQLSQDIECTLHGKTRAYPKSSLDASLFLCSIRVENLDAIFTMDSGSVRFEGDAAKLILDLLPNLDFEGPATDDFSGTSPKVGTRIMKSFGESGVDGINCTHVDYDDVKRADYRSCSISWR